MLTSVVGVVVLLGGLIFFHEAGHYLMAKFFGIRVEVFSLGFGKKIFRRQWGETEYCLSLIPLGGYVKLMGDDPYKSVPPEDVERAFSTQKLYKRFLVVAAGPLANLLLAYVLFMAVFYAGQPRESTRIGRVVYKSPAYEAGLRPGDRVLAVGPTFVTTWTEMEDTLRTQQNKNLTLTVERGDKRVELPFTVGAVRLRNPYGEEELVGGIKGIAPNPLQPMVGISSSTTPAFQAGLRTGDLVTKVGDKSVATYDAFNQALRDAWKSGASVALTYQRGLGTDAKVSDHTGQLQFPSSSVPENESPLGIGVALGFYPSELVVYKVNPDSPAEKAGLKTGDRVVSVNGNPVYNFETIVDAVQDSGQKKQEAQVVLERDGQAINLSVAPIETSQTDPITGQEQKRFLLGFMPQSSLAESEIVRLQVREPVRLVQRAVGEVNLLAKRMLISIVKLVTGSISVKNLGGPVLIASVAGKSLDAGIVPFLQMMALISINLFLLNLFPVPVLDGGHLLFFIIEAIKGKPVSIRTMEIANQLGMVFILMLVGLTLFNDISRIVLN